MGVDESVISRLDVCSTPLSAQVVIRGTGFMQGRRKSGSGGAHMYVQSLNHYHIKMQ